MNHELGGGREPLVVSEGGLIGINKQSNIMNYHSEYMNPNTGLLNDMDVGGSYNKRIAALYEISIYSTGNPNQFRWRKSIDNGITWGAYSSPIDCALTVTTIENDVTVVFGHVIGHNTDDIWRFTAFPQLPNGTFTITSRMFMEINNVVDYTIPSPIYEDITYNLNTSLVTNATTILEPGTDGALYIGDTIKYHSMYIDILDPAVGCTLYLEYWNGLTNAWTRVSPSTNDMIDGTSNLTKSGKISWDISTFPNWAKRFPEYNLTEPSYNLYWLRIRSTTAVTNVPNIISIVPRGGVIFSVSAAYLDALPIFEINADGHMYLRDGYNKNANIYFNSLGQGGGHLDITASGTSGEIFTVNDDNGSCFVVGDSTGTSKFKNNLFVGDIAGVSTARLNIKGATSDTSAYGIKMTNSSNVVKFSVRNDGLITGDLAVSTSNFGYILDPTDNTVQKTLDRINVHQHTVGMTHTGLVSDNGDGTIDITSGYVQLYSNPSWEGTLEKYIVPAVSNVSLTDESTNYIYVDYNSGSPVYAVTTLTSIINNSDKTLVANIYRESSTILHIIDANWAKATSTRLNDRLIQQQRFVRTSGLGLMESATRHIDVGNGLVYYGIRYYVLSAVASDVDTCDLYYHSSGNWVKTSITQYNNTQYDNGTNLQTLSNPNKYAVNWIYRFIEDDKHIAVILGSGDYDVTAARNSQPPMPPTVLNRQAILVGRILVQNNISTAYQIDSAFTTIYETQPAQVHNDLGGLQGGYDSSEFYHLNQSQYVISTQAATSVLSGYLTPLDWNTFNNKQPAGNYIVSLSGDVTATGPGSIAATIGNKKVTFAKIQDVATTTILGRDTAGVGSIETLSTSLVRSMLSINNVENTSLSTWAGTTNITTLGTIGTGVWNATTIADNKIAATLTGKTYNGLTLTAVAVGFTVAGGTTSKTLTVSLDASVAGTNTGDVTLATNSGLALSNQVLNIGTPSTITGATTNSVTTNTHTHALTVTKTDVGLGSVENTALSTWAGTTNITTVGTIGTGTWNATAIADGKITSTLTGKTYNGLNLTAVAIGFTVAGGTTSKTLTVPLDASVSNTNTGDVTLATNSGLAISSQVLNMGTPSNVSISSTNSVTTNTHTHALDLSGFNLYGGMYQTANATATTMGVANQWYKVVNFTTGLTSGVTYGTSDLTVGTTGIYMVQATVTAVLANSADLIEVAIAVGGTPQTKTTAQMSVSNVSQHPNSAPTGILSLTAGNVVTLMIRNSTTRNCTISYANVILHRIA